MRKAARRATAAGALAFNNAFILGQRMLTYIQNLQYYMTFEVLEPNWNSFFQFLDKVSMYDVYFLRMWIGLNVFMGLLGFKKQVW